MIDAGLAGGSYEWDPLAAEISAVTEVCTYDRAGYGWSDRGPSPRNSERIVAELHTLLEKARVKPPFILVGHSFGVKTSGSMRASTQTKWQAWCWWMP